MLSRSAEDLYWMSRYVERAENAARTLDISYRMSRLPSLTAHDELHWPDTGEPIVSDLPIDSTALTGPPTFSR